MKLNLLILFSLLSAMQSLADVVKQLREMEGHGTVKWMASSVAGPTITYSLTLNNELLWKYVYNGTSSGSVIDPFLHSQLIDILIKNDECSFLLSGYEGVHFRRLKRVGGVWIEQVHAYANGLSASPTNSLAKILLSDLNIIKTIAEGGGQVLYRIDNLGAISPNRSAQVHRGNGADIIVVPQSTNSSKGKE